jgi:sugar/nucleoside kinase (ribokinase family)
MIIVNFIATNSIGNISSLVTTLQAAEMFEQSHLSSPTVAPLVDAANVFYVEGFFLTHGASIVLELSKKASAASKVFALNFSAPFIPQFFGTQLKSVLPYCDIIIGNETEAEAYAAANGLPDTKDLAAIAKAVATSPKSNASRPRVVIFTHGAESTILVSSAEPDSPKVFKVSPIDGKLIVDTNGAGDAFAGGFLGAYVAGKSLDECVEVGHKMGAMCVQLVSRCSLISGHSLIMDPLGWSPIPLAQGLRSLNTSNYHIHILNSLLISRFQQRNLLYPYTYGCSSSLAFHKHVATDISNLWFR